MYETIIGLVVAFVFLVAYTLFLKVWWKKDIERTFASYEVMPTPAIQQPAQEQAPVVTQQEYEKSYYDDAKQKDAELKGVVGQPELQPVKQETKYQEPIPIPIPVPEPVPIPIPVPKPIPIIGQPEVVKVKQPVQVFKCPKCNKQFKNEKLVKRHYGMAHYADLEI